MHLLSKKGMCVRKPDGERTCTSKNNRLANFVKYIHNQCSVHPLARLRIFDTANEQQSHEQKCQRLAKRYLSIKSTIVRNNGQITTRQPVELIEILKSFEFLRCSVWPRDTLLAQLWRPTNKDFRYPFTSLPNWPRAVAGMSPCSPKKTLGKVTGLSRIYETVKTWLELFVHMVTETVT